MKSYETLVRGSGVGKMGISAEAYFVLLPTVLEVLNVVRHESWW